MSRKDENFGKRQQCDANNSADRRLRGDLQEASLGGPSSTARRRSWTKPPMAAPFYTTRYIPQIPSAQEPIQADVPCAKIQKKKRKTKKKAKDDNLFTRMGCAFKQSFSNLSARLSRTKLPEKPAPPHQFFNQRPPQDDEPPDLQRRPQLYQRPGQQALSSRQREPRATSTENPPWQISNRLPETPDGCQVVHRHQPISPTHSRRQGGHGTQNSSSRRPQSTRHEQPSPGTPPETPKRGKSARRSLFAAAGAAGVAGLARAAAASAKAAAAAAARLSQIDQLPPQLDDFPPSQVDNVSHPRVEHVPHPRVEHIPHPRVEHIPHPHVDHIPHPHVDHIPQPHVDNFQAPHVDNCPPPDLNADEIFEIRKIGGLFGAKRPSFFAKIKRKLDNPDAPGVDPPWNMRTREEESPRSYFERIGPPDLTDCIITVENQLPSPPAGGPSPRRPNHPPTPPSGEPSPRRLHHPPTPPSGEPSPRRPHHPPTPPAGEPYSTSQAILDQQRQLYLDFVAKGRSCDGPVEVQDPGYLPLREEVLVLLDGMDPNAQYFHYLQDLARELNHGDDVPSYEKLVADADTSGIPVLKFAASLLEDFHDYAHRNYDHLTIPEARYQLAYLQTLWKELLERFQLYRKILRDTYGACYQHPRLDPNHPVGVLRVDAEGTYVDLRYGFEWIFQELRNRMSELEWMDPRKRRFQLESMHGGRGDGGEDIDRALSFMEDAYGVEDLMLPEIEIRIVYLVQRLRELRNAQRNRPPDAPEPYNYEKIGRALKRKIRLLNKLRAANQNLPNRDSIRISEKFDDSGEE